MKYIHVWTGAGFYTVCMRHHQSNLGNPPLGLPSFKKEMHYELTETVAVHRKPELVLSQMGVPVLREKK